MASLFHELVNKTAIEHVCSAEDVIRFCSQWFLGERQGIEHLAEVLEEYGTLRDLGNTHHTAANMLLSILRTATVVPTSTTMTVLPYTDIRSISKFEYELQLKELRKRRAKRNKALARKKLLEDNIRMLRDD